MNPAIQQSRDDPGCIPAQVSPAVPSCQKSRTPNEGSRLIGSASVSVRAAPLRHPAEPPSTSRNAGATLPRVRR
jgi:hypothetical protein